MLFTLVTKGKLDIDTAAEEAGVIYQNVNSKNPLTIVFGIADFLCQKSITFDCYCTALLHRHRLTAV